MAKKTPAEKRAIKKLHKKHYHNYMPQGNGVYKCECGHTVKKI